jgi:hypothetical protein
VLLQKQLAVTYGAGNLQQSIPDADRGHIIIILYGITCYNKAPRPMHMHYAHVQGRPCSFLSTSSQQFLTQWILDRQPCKIQMCKNR